ncbi:cyclic nucleotide-binding domain-containing protein [Fusobacteria bacterium ZRK30]|nr:cyclic nucleotide-binding domain-containing protein [Fusobacteria bacterium ZRK30]
MKKNELEKEIFKIVPQLSFFGGTSHEEIHNIMEYIHEEKVEAGNYVYREGDSPENIYILLEGEMDFFILEEKIAHGEVGLLFGTSATIGIQKQLVSAMAKTDIKLGVIAKSFFIEMSEKDPKLFVKIILNVARDLARDLKFLKDYVKKQKSKEVI